MTPRMRRLYADHIRLGKCLEGHRHIRVQNASGDPPEQFEIEYLIVGLREEEQGIVERRGHRVRIQLPITYPQEKPICRMLTPIFHPNIAPQGICIADYWTAGESLANLVIRIGEMIAYQRYNIRSPLNGEAAKWASENLSRLPVDATNLAPLLRPEEVTIALEEIERWRTSRTGQGTGRELAEVCFKEQQTVPMEEALEPRPSDQEARVPCANCGRQTASSELTRCANQHVVCDDCLVMCARCGAVNCVLCPLATCAVCRAIVCQRCVERCASCRRSVCREHLARCGFCGVSVCSECLHTCSECQGRFCGAHLGSGIERCSACAGSGAEVVRITYEEMGQTEPRTPEGPADRRCAACGAPAPDVAGFCATCGSSLAPRT